MRRARLAVLAVFALNGLVLGSWSARMPAVSRQVHAGPGAIGLALLGVSVGLIGSAPFVGRLCARFGARIVVVLAALLYSLLVPLIGQASSIPVLAVAFLLIGCAAGGLDVSMNIAAVQVVRALDRPLMPEFHAAFSLGGLAGSLGASGAVALGWSPLRHFLVIGLLGLALVGSVAAWMPGARPAPEPAGTRPSTARPPIRRPVLWLLAGIMLASAIAEGSCSDWSALFLVRQRGIGESAAAIGYAGFSVAMAVSRLLGERWERRWGAYRLLAGGGVLAAVGMFGVVLVPWAPAGYLGFALVGAGLAFSFPVTIGLAGAAGRRADGSGGEREIAFVSTIAYTGFLAGPPMIGAVAQATNLAVALGVVAVVITLVVPLVVTARQARDREQHRVTRATAGPPVR